MYKFTDRKPQLPYRKEGIELQFLEEVVEARETETITLEWGGTEEKVMAYYYKKYSLPWREEFNKGAEYDIEGNPIKKSYIDENYEILLAEAKALTKQF